MFVQLPLKIGLREEAKFDTFVAEEESIAISVAWLQNQVIDSKNNFIALVGEKGTGKTHLLQSCCRFFGEQQNSSNGNSAVYLPLADKSLPLVPAILDGLEMVKLICLDDVDEILGNKEWELALADLIAKSQVLGQKLIISSKQDFNDWTIKTKALSNAIIVVSTIILSGLTKHDELIEALKKRSEVVGFDFRQEVGNFLIKQFSNELSELIAVLQIIENASIVQKRKITLPFVKSVLANN